MFCMSCGQEMSPDARFCNRCGAELSDESHALLSDTPQNRYSASSVSRRPADRSRRKSNDPYRDQIAALRLQIRQVKLALRQITSGMSNTRSQYYQTAAFVPHGLLRRGYKWIEDIRLLGPQQQKEQLQQEVMRLEQELLRLQQAQFMWKQQQQE